LTEREREREMHKASMDERWNAESGNRIFCISSSTYSLTGFKYTSFIQAIAEPIYA
jgi:hypothetical protein